MVKLLVTNRLREPVGVFPATIDPANIMNKGPNWIRLDARSESGVPQLVSRLR